MKILVVDDNYGVVETIVDYLEMEGVFTDSAYNGVSAINLINQNYYDVIIMDIMMPKMDGIKAVRKLRNDFYCNTPIIFLTAKGTLQDKVAAFNSGGDDYLDKPFAMEELFLRLQSLHNRGPRLDLGLLSFSDLSMNLQTNQVFRAGQKIKLSKTQYSILKILLKHAPALVSKEEVINTVWGQDAPSSDVLRSHIYGLRNALDKDFSISRLETVHGQGYRLNA
ncbi:response regulator transcription factor (plasmid) [Vibrio cyclitrophicus]|uniref:response regulator transcription factor n=2 Tax=Vibrio TaxID=662 RepID=UPI000C850CF7|nr:response regulator transcription factor [Vibrio cyclitrophicus]PMJ49111.1 two-component system response regulator [Vibrio cyclitrophicus]